MISHVIEVAKAEDAPMAVPPTWKPTPRTPRVARHNTSLAHHNLSWVHLKERKRDSKVDNAFLESSICTLCSSSTPSPPPLLCFSLFLSMYFPLFSSCPWLFYFFLIIMKNWASNSFVSPFQLQWVPWHMLLFRGCREGRREEAAPRWESYSAQRHACFLAW